MQLLRALVRSSCNARRYPTCLTLYPQLEVAPGVLMPTVGYGTAGLAELTADAVFTAIRTGYRLVDSAQVREQYCCWLFAGWGRCRSAPCPGQSKRKVSIARSRQQASPGQEARSAMGMPCMPPKSSLGTLGACSPILVQAYEWYQEDLVGWGWRAR